MTTLLTLTQTNNATLTMSSREIAELIEKRHDNVKRTIEMLINQGVIVRPQIEDEQIQDKLGRPRTEKVYLLPKRDTYIVVAQLCPEFTAKLVDRWQELENQVNQPLDPIKMLNDPYALRGLLGNYTEKVIKLEHQIEAIQPAANAYHRIATKSDGSLNLTETAKVLQIQPKQLINWLSAQKWIYKRAGGKNWIAYQEKIQQNVLEHKTHTAIREDGTEKICDQVLVTAKGIAKLSKIFELEQAA